MKRLLGRVVSTRTSFALAGVTYAAVLLVALTVGMGRSESALPAAPSLAWSESADAGSKTVTSFVPAVACTACDAYGTTDDRLLSPLQARPAIFIPSTAAYVYDQTCGEALFGKNEDKQLPPASLTKMMTALVTVERVPDLNQTVPVQTSARALAIRTNSSVMGLEPNMEVTVLDLLYGLMLPSGNDAAIELAEFIAGDVESFVDLMNAKADALGLAGTEFANPHGLDARALRSTARDLVVLGEAMMANPLLAQVASSQDYTLDGGLSFNNGNRMVGSYTGAYGVKIGYTGDAAHTIVVAAERDGRRIYASVLGSKVPYVDATSLLDWAFSKPPAC